MHRERGRPRTWLLGTAILVFVAMSGTARADLEPDAEKEKLDYGFMVSSTRGHSPGAQARDSKRILRERSQRLV